MIDEPTKLKKCIHCDYVEGKMLERENLIPRTWPTESCCSRCHERHESLVDSMAEGKFNVCSALQIVCIRARDFSQNGHKKIYVYFVDGVVCCYPTKMQRLHANHVASYSIKTILSGLSRDRWNDLTRKLSNSHESSVFDHDCKTKDLFC